MREIPCRMRGVFRLTAPLVAVTTLRQATLEVKLSLGNVRLRDGRRPEGHVYRWILDLRQHHAQPSGGAGAARSDAGKEGSLIALTFAALVAAFGGAFLLTWPLTKAMSTPNFVTSLLIATLVSLSLDYSLFLLSHLKGSLRAGLSMPDAV
jgi:hypothetical protein